jgi:hypothetical protein
MMPTLPIRHSTDTRYSGRRSHGSTSACVGRPDSSVVTTPMPSRKLSDRVPTYPPRRPHLCADAKQPPRPPQSALPAPRPVAKSP